MSQVPDEEFRLVLQSLRYDKKWEHLKPIIIKMFVDEKRELPFIIEHMKSEFNFSAQ